jgi:hypothetical protein
LFIEGKIVKVLEPEPIKIFIPDAADLDRWLDESKKIG